MIVCERGEIQGINYYLNGLQMINNPDISFVCLDDKMLDPNMVLSVIKSYNQELLVISYNIKDVATVEELKELLTKIDTVIGAIYDNTENHYVILRNEKYLNHKWFTFFILIGLAEPYKWYLKSKYKKQTINIKKIISTRNDLFSDENNQLYQSLNPSIILNNTKYKYKMEDIGANKKNSPPQAANESEIAEANKINNLNNYLFQVNNSIKIVDDGFGITGFSNDYKAFK